MPARTDRDKYNGEHEGRITASNETLKPAEKPTEKIYILYVDAILRQLKNNRAHLGCCCSSCPIKQPWQLLPKQSKVSMVHSVDRACTD